jgi:hypothetical protein
MLERSIAVRDMGETLTFSLASIYAYCGPAQIIASALMFRLFERAFFDLSPEAPPDRGDIQFLSGFSGTGIAECVELVTRIRTRRPGCFRVDPEAAPPQAPAAVSGFMYFEVQIKEKRKGYWPPGELFDDVFRKNVRLFQSGGGTAEEREAYLDYKKRLSAAILRAPGESLFSVRGVRPEAMPE